MKGLQHRYPQIDLSLISAVSRLHLFLNFGRIPSCKHIGEVLSASRLLKKTNKDRHLIVQGGLEIPVKSIAEIDASENNEGIMNKLKQLILENYRERQQAWRWQIWRLYWGSITGLSRSQMMRNKDMRWTEYRMCTPSRRKTWIQVFV